MNESSSIDNIVRWNLSCLLMVVLAFPVKKNGNVKRSPERNKIFGGYSEDALLTCFLIPLHEIL